MTAYKTEFSEQDLATILNTYSEEADKILDDKSKLIVIIEKVRKMIQKIRNVPVLSSVLEEVLTMLELLSDYIVGEYKEVPKHILVSIVAAFLYMVSPTNLIPNWIPIIGVLDDVAVIKFILRWGAGKELEKYKCWKAEREDEIRHKNAKQYLISSIKKNLHSNEVLVAAFLTYDRKIDVLIADENQTSKPIQCRKLLIDVQHEGEIWDIINLYKDALNDSSIRWSMFGVIPFQMEYEYTQFNNDFIILEE